ncbi:sensor histidine kinase [Phycicoccus sonneratiae]|uniref:Signal transduction histidine-protein kinase/phosphatase MprB n=1 Tax=Phycicoccus sonneratiae TaxID=2807628 RepID=A0ABS2CJ97_9MICO|nr:HAMP domain-containing sensor histidine kinase [Phycicoccus sonneraticus]MBM6399946.1 HAMP domain-containing histidine kinase [Phycicoccus sonneraticus]
MTRARGAGRTRTGGGLRARIAAVVILVVLAAVAGLGVAVHLLVLREQVDTARRAAADRMAAALDVRAATGLLSFDAREDDPAVPAELRDAVRGDGARATLVTGGSVRTVWAAGRSGDVVLSTRTRLVPGEGTLAQVDRALLLAGVVVVLLAGLVGWVTAGRLARRLRRAAETARTVASGGDPASLRRVVGDRRDEVGALAEAVDAMAGRLAERVRAEQRFTADVAHDLRTPVTGLLTAAELLEPSRAAELVRDRARALAALVEELLEVARLDGGDEQALVEQVDLGEVVRRVVRRGVASGELPAEAVTVSSDGPALVATDARRVDRVVSNLVRNALRHGAAPVEVAQRGSVVEVRDHGPGFDEPLLRDGPQRLRHDRADAGGHGLGLVIAAGQAGVLGARLELDNAPGGGARARLLLPATPPGAADVPPDAVPHDEVTDGSRARERTGRRP